MYSCLACFLVLASLPILRARRPPAVIRPVATFTTRLLPAEVSTPRSLAELAIVSTKPRSASASSVASVVALEEQTTFVLGSDTTNLISSSLSISCLVILADKKAANLAAGASTLSTRSST